MSTPPIQPNIPELPPAGKGRISLAKLAIAFTIIIVLTFGLCSITLINSNSSINGPIFPIAIVIEGICILGLIVVAIMAIVRSFKS